jgi:hypothetical protein
VKYRKYKTKSQYEVEIAVVADEEKAEVVESSQRGLTIVLVVVVTVESIERQNAAVVIKQLLLS